MSPAIFDNLKSERPDLNAIWDPLVREARRQPKRQFIVLEAIAPQLAEVPPERIAEALRLLLSKGDVKQAYRIRTPEGSLRGATYDSPDEIPAQVEGEFGRPFRRDDGRIVPVIVEVRTHG